MVEVLNASSGKESSKRSQGTGSRPVLCTVTLTAMVSPTSAVTWLHCRVAVKLPLVPLQRHAHDNFRFSCGVGGRWNRLWAKAGSGCRRRAPEERRLLLVKRAGPCTAEVRGSNPLRSTRESAQIDVISFSTG